MQRVRGQGRDREFEPIPDVKPYFRRIHVGEDGRIWVFRYVAAEKRHDIEPVPERPGRPIASTGAGNELLDYSILHRI